MSDTVHSTSGSHSAVPVCTAPRWNRWDWDFLCLCQNYLRLRGWGKDIAVYRTDLVCLLGSSKLYKQGRVAICLH